MFRLPKPDETFPTPCTIEMPEGPDTVEREITIFFRVLPITEYDRLARTDVADLLVALIGGWSEVYDAEEEPMACTETNIRAAAGISYFVRGVLLGYAERFSPAKNFRAPLAN